VAFGLAGGFLLYFFFDWTLIIVSSLVGSVVSLLGVRAFAEMPEAVHVWAFVILAVMGMWYQARDMRSEAARARAATNGVSGTAGGKAPAAPARPVQSSAGAAAPPAPKPAPVAPAMLPPQQASQSTWPAAVQRPATPRPQSAAPFQSSPQAWG
jgi:hypothetical protein